MLCWCGGKKDGKMMCEGNKTGDAWKEKASAFVYPQSCESERVSLFFPSSLKM